MNIIRAFNKEKIFTLCIWIIFLLSVFIRFKGIISNCSLWHDESAVAWNVKFKTFSELFGVLRFDQMAPPLFMIATKCLTKLLGFQEWVFRLIPFVFGIVTLPAFYFLAKKTLTKKSSILIAFFLFATNELMINYSFELKPYGIDVFFSIICLLFFLNLKLENLPAKKTLIYGCSLALFPWFSLVSVFTIFSGFLITFLKDLKSNFTNKLILILPIFISGLLYLKFYFLNNYENSSYFMMFWQNCFVKPDLLLFFKLLFTNINYFFFPAKFILFLIILFFWGIFLFCRQNKAFATLSLLSIGTLILASMMHFYPFAERLILFIFPLFLLYIVKPLDLISTNKKVLSVIIILLFSSVFYLQLLDFFNLLNANKFDRKEYPREMMEFLYKNLSPNDIIYVNKSSDADFAYYSSFYDIKNKIVQEEINPNISKADYLKKLNSLPKGYYWFYLPIDYVTVPISPWIEEWSKNNEIIYLYTYKEKYRSLLMYIKVK